MQQLLVDYLQTAEPQPEKVVLAARYKVLEERAKVHRLREHFFLSGNVLDRHRADQFTEEYFDTEKYELLGLNCWLVRRRWSDGREEWDLKESVRFLALPATVAPSSDSP